MGWAAWINDRLRYKPIDATALQLTAEAREKLCKALRADSISTVQDLLNSLLLSECVYKAHDHGPQEAVRNLRAAQETFPEGLTTIGAVQSSLRHVRHRYLVADSPETVYVSFIGTKLAKDLLVDVNFLHRPLWQTEAAADSPAAHRGFLARAERVPVEQLLALAQKDNKKLLLCGHSLGGAVAVLCALRVLQHASDEGLTQPRIGCITFGTPAIGNSALAARVERQGWSRCFQNVVLPEDLVPRLLALRPEASTAELNAAVLLPPATQPAGQRIGGQRRWPSPGFASRLTPFRAPLPHTRAGGGRGGPDDALSRGTKRLSAPRAMPATEEESVAGEGQDAFARRGSEQHAGEHSGGRAWALPRRLWQRSNPSQDLQLLPPLATSAQGFEDETVDGRSDVADTGYTVPSSVGGALQSVGRRLPLQGWWGGSKPDLPGDSSRGSTIQATAGLQPGGTAALLAADEDGAVDALVEGPLRDGGAAVGPPERVAATRSSWLARLAQLQGVAASAATSIGGVGGALLPTYVHFGRSIVWPVPAEQSKQLPASFPTADLRSRVLANHRMPAYRVRALAHCAEAAGLPAAATGACASAFVSEDVLPRVTLCRATADLPPLPPSDAPGTSGGRWSWIPYVGSDGNGQAAPLTVRLSVAGEALDGLRQGRLLAYGSTWCPVRILGVEGRAAGRAAPQAVAGEWRAGVLGWLRGRWEEPAGGRRLEVEARLPGAVASQVYRSDSHGAASALELHLRSDFAELAVPAAVRLPTVWVLGSSQAATRRLLAALGAGAVPGSAAPPLVPSQPAELVLDGCRWRDLLSAPVASPRLALSAMGAALRPAGGREGPLGLAAGVLQGLQSWLGGPQSQLREGASCSAIVLALDESARPLQRQLAALLSQAERAGVTCVLTTPLGSDRGIIAALRPRAAEATVIEIGTGRSEAAALAQLRQAAFRALSEQLAPEHPGSVQSKL